MQTVTKIIVEQGLADRIIRAEQLARLLGGSEGRRYALVNRALKSGELLRLQRGMYVLDVSYRRSGLHPFALAQAFVPGSYVSFETALSYHGWIPEKVVSTSSAVPGRKAKQIDHEIFGMYRFYPLATNPGCFLKLVNRASDRCWTNCYVLVAGNFCLFDTVKDLLTQRVMLTI